MKVETPRCLHCGKTSTLELTEEEVRALATDKLIQHALPERDASFREMVMTGTHPDCWDALFPEESS